MGECYVSERDLTSYGLVAAAWLCIFDPKRSSGVNLREGVA